MCAGGRDGAGQKDAAACIGGGVQRKCRFCRFSSSEREAGAPRVCSNGWMDGQRQSQTWDRDGPRIGKRQTVVVSGPPGCRSAQRSPTPRPTQARQCQQKRRGGKLTKPGLAAAAAEPLCQPASQPFRSLPTCPHTSKHPCLQPSIPHPPSPIPNPHSHPTAGAALPALPWLLALPGCLPTVLTPCWPVAGSSWLAGWLVVVPSRGGERQDPWASPTQPCLIPAISPRSRSPN